ncbi:TPA: hypothetical protein NIB84_000746 [Pseudomonas aeruginosa]|uniref:hypothetical protein n=1 Tax=Pseudomonas aeruginosa TaxID=287 RepID=UPI000C791AC4|nr:hypothetical protein [Pseudomonas aeruginosa]MBA5099619.1 hypothetical protein [Pseudomonas aeruginosa]HCE7209809.1 hypothetical protein [Pseudomonas aeruginosa]HCE7545666.1 hypothetical protein [Pseudomonas aeruginosa]HCE7574768.1 hypothetical protein [Pseudomonas aeruginosa]HCE7847208.1 hypothetical protein [Pseudomonas aeruginosa]
MSIDWSCAPAEATHYCIGDDLNPWRKIVGTTVYAFNRKKWVMWSSFNEGYMPAYYAPIPLEAWDGQGLPPVGTVCEYRHMIWPEYRPCEIRYISEESLVAYDDAQEQFYRTCDMLFRPIRTPEQIAAEEREKAVGDMAMSIQGVPYQYPTLYALYDAGYRRQEEGK